jgi:putative transposase
MPRRPREHAPGGVYHVTIHGIDQRPIFRDELDRQWFVNHLSVVAREREWFLYSVCLMTTHFHLIVQLRDANLALGMQKLNGEYARAFNVRHRRRGPVFEARYSDTHIIGETHLKGAIRYVAQNPVEAGMVDRPQDWLWSTYAQLIGEEPAWPCFKPAAVRELFGGIEVVRHFVEDQKVPGTFGAGHRVKV